MSQATASQATASSNTLITVYICLNFDLKTALGTMVSRAHQCSKRNDLTPEYMPGYPQEYHSVPGWHPPTNKLARRCPILCCILPPTDGAERHKIQKREGVVQKASTLNKASFGSLAASLPDQLPDAETGKRVVKAARVGGDRALAALKRSVRVIAAARYFSQAGQAARYERGKNATTNLASVVRSIRNSSQSIVESVWRVHGASVCVLYSKNMMAQRKSFRCPSSRT